MVQTHCSFASKVPAPTKVPFHTSFTYRFVEQTIQQAIIQKLPKIATGLKAADLLIERGLLQEAATIQRAVDEAQEDILFLAYGQITGTPSGYQEEFLKIFWAEDLESNSRIRRPKVRDYIARSEASATGAQEAEIVAPAITLYKMYSGFAHAASIQLMELFDGSPPHWRLTGNVGSQFQRDHFYDLRNQYFRGLIAFGFAAMVFNDQVGADNIFTFANTFIASTEEQ